MRRELFQRAKDSAPACAKHVLPAVAEIDALYRKGLSLIQLNESLGDLNTATKLRQFATREWTEIRRGEAAPESLYTIGGRLAGHFVLHACHHDPP